MLSRADLVDVYGPPRAGTVVFTNGVFDLLHPGHITYLEEARALGDCLVVGVNSDSSARRLGKGADRPIQPEADRALLVASLRYVDAVGIFHEDTPATLIEELRPDVLVKGGDYSADSVAGRETVIASGGRVVIIPLVTGHSSSNIIERIRRAKDG